MSNERLRAVEAKELSMETSAPNVASVEEKCALPQHAVDISK
jgi:hypothetical protein